MITLRRYRDSVAAHCAADALRNAGIPAEVVGEHSFHTLPVHTYGFASLHLVIPSEDDRERAEHVLSTLTDEANPLEALPEPDLSRLAPQHRKIACPSCAADFTIRQGLDRCPSCAAPIDPLALVADAFGPEALTPCYDDSIVACPSCAAPLSQATPRGRCPSCGRAYDLTRAPNRTQP